MNKLPFTPGIFVSLQEPTEDNLTDEELFNRRVQAIKDEFTCKPNTPQTRFAIKQAVWDLLHTMKAEGYKIGGYPDIEVVVESAKSTLTVSLKRKE